MFTSSKNRANRAFAKGARRLTNEGTYRLIADSTSAGPTGPKLAPNNFPTPTQKPMLKALSTPIVQRKRLHLLTFPLLASVAGLAACSKADNPAAATASNAMAPAQAYEKVATTGKGFTVGALMSANPVFVLFDPQCPHCGHLWNSSQALLGKVKFIWIPVSFINGKSAPQGAAILSASDPAAFMASHEASLLAGTGGTPSPTSMSPEAEATIKANTELFNSLKAESVPYIVAKNLITGGVVTHAGAMETAALAAFLGV
jgi:thiol:disulfide interchange protein DsbG